MSRLLTADDGLPIPADIVDHVAVKDMGGRIDIFVSETRAGSPAVLGLASWFARRLREWGAAAIHIVTYEAVQQHLGRDKGAGATVSMERLALDLIRVALDIGASDMQLRQEPTGAGVIRYRVDGDYINSDFQFSGRESEELCRVFFTISDGNSRSGSYSPDTSFDAAIVDNLKALGLADVCSAIRLHGAAAARGPTIWARFTPQFAKLPTIASLDLSAWHREVLLSSLDNPSGAILIGAPPGAGKTRTLGTLMEYFTGENPEKSAVAVEDPVETLLTAVTQMQVSAKDPDLRERELLQKLRDVVRSDPDLLMFGEVRDEQSARAFLKAAIVGRVSLSTLHTNSAAGIIDRFREWGIGPKTLKNPTTLAVLMATRLVKTLCPHCRIPIREAAGMTLKREPLHARVARMHRYAKESFALRATPLPTIQDGYVRNTDGCSRCRRPDTYGIKRPAGVTGRTLLAEVIPCDATYLHHAAEGSFDVAERYLRTSLKAPSIFDDAYGRIAAGQISPIDAEAAVGRFPASPFTMLVEAA